MQCRWPLESVGLYDLHPTSGLNEAFQKKNVERRPHELLSSISCALKKNINLKLGETIMGKAEVGLVVIQGLSINFIRFVCSSMAVGAQRDQVFVLVLLARFPRDDVVDVHINVTASGDSASVSGFNENSAAKLCRNWWAITHSSSMRHTV
jgi:hypothetical protein